MKTVRHIIVSIAVSILAMASFSVNADEPVFPSLTRKTSRSHGLLSRAVEQPSKPQKTLIDYSQMLDDVPFNVDATNEVETANPSTPTASSDEEELVEENIVEPVAEKVELEKKSEQIEKDPSSPPASSDKKEPLKDSEQPEKKDDLKDTEPDSEKEKSITEKDEEEAQELVKGEDLPVDQISKIDPEPVVKQKDKKIEEIKVEIQQEPDQPEPDEIVFNFENADLLNLVSYIESLFEVTFITDDAINPMAKDGRQGVAHNKISFKTHKPLSRKQAWSLFLTFLDMANLSVVPTADKKIYRIVRTDTVVKKAGNRRAALPTFIGIDSELLPDDDTKIRFIYFIKDTPAQTLVNLVQALGSGTEDINVFLEMKAMLIIGSSYNIKSLMRIVRELDKVNMPQAMSVLKLRRVEAKDVKKLYDDLVGPQKQQRPGAPRLFGPRKSATSLYFPEHARMIVEERTNSLILLGTEEDIKRIEDFIVKNIDVELEASYSPLHVHPLKYADAKMIAKIMTEVVKFGGDTSAARVGGVRGKDKYLKSMTFTAEDVGNRLVVRGEYEDYLKVKDIIDRLDAPQPQVAIEILILSVGISDIKELGSQLRNRPRSEELHKDGLLGKNINFQTSGIRLGGIAKTIVPHETITSGTKRLLGDLVNLITGASAGNTVLTLGNDAYGVWGVFHALRTITNLQVISNPFLVATNKTQATVSLGENRNVPTATISGTQDVQTFEYKDAKLEVIITPQINSDGMIILDLNIEIVEFRDDVAGTEAAAAAARTRKVINTTTILADKEVLALGGLIKNKIEDGVSKLPVLGSIPILGWLFKNKKKSEVKEDLLVLISARIIDPEITQEGDMYTKGHVQDYKATVKQMRQVHSKRDFIDRNFFDEKKEGNARRMDKFIFRREKKEKKSKKKKRRRKKKKKKPTAAGVMLADSPDSIADRFFVKTTVSDPSSVVVRDGGTPS